VLPGSRARIVRCGGRYDPQLVKRSSEWVSGTNPYSWPYPTQRQDPDPKPPTRRAIFWETGTNPYSCPYPIHEAGTWPYPTHVSEGVDYLNNLISVQPPRRTRSSSVVTLSRPPTISVTRSSAVAERPCDASCCWVFSLVAEGCSK